jgi:hypothetical protein
MRRLVSLFAASFVLASVPASADLVTVRFEFDTTNLEWNNTADAGLTTLFPSGANGWLEFTYDDAAPPLHDVALLSPMRRLSYHLDGGFAATFQPVALGSAPYLIGANALYPTPTSFGGSANIASPRLGLLSPFSTQSLYFWTSLGAVGDVVDGEVTMYFDDTRPGHSNVHLARSRITGMNIARVPEPGTMLLVLAGAGAYALRRRRRADSDLQG